MSFAFYIYTTIIMGVALVTSAVALVVWLMTRRRDSLVAAAGFLLNMLDMSVIFFDEYNRLKYDYAAHARTRYRAVFNLAIAAGASQRRCRRGAAVSLLAHA